LVISAATCWASLGVLGKLAFRAGMNPGSVVLFRALAATALLVVALGVFDRRALRLPLRSMPLFLGLGMTLALSSSAFFHGVEHLEVGVAISLFYLYPALVSVIARVALGEPLTRRKLMAIVVSLVGCALVGGLVGSRGVVSWLGVALSLAAALACAVYTVLVKVAVRDHPAFRVPTYSLVFAVPFLGLAGVLGGAGLEAPPSLAAWGVIGLLALFPTLVGYSLFALGLRWIESSRASIVATLEPVLAALLAFAVLGETLRWVQAAGIVLILSGAILAQAERREPRRAAPIFP
jgi:drug/metabolite transporter, DME family